MAEEATLPGVDESDDEPVRCIAHVDMDCFYAACERLREPTLADEAVIVGMGYEPGADGGVVATASYEAREYGIHSAQPISEALERLPPASVMPEDYTGPVAQYRPVDLPYYREVSDAVATILEEAADTIRFASLDEAYLDVTERTTWADAAAFGAEFKADIADRVGVPASVGIAPTLGVAKIASDHDKPDGLTVVEPAAVQAFLDPLPVADLHGVGPVTESELEALGCETIGDVASLDPGQLESHLGERGRELAQRARGAGTAVVEPQGRPKSLSRESSLGDARDDVEAIRARVTELAADVAARAASKGAQYRTIGIKAVEPPFEVHTRERTFNGPFTDPDLVESTALDLLEEFADRPLRKVGVRVSNLDFGGDQRDLEAYENEAIEAEPTGPIRRQRSLDDY